MSSDLAGYADQVGLTKLEALVHLEAFLGERGLLEEAKRDLARAGEERAREDIARFCFDCGNPRGLKDFTNPDGTVKLCPPCHRRASAS